MQNVNAEHFNQLLSGSPYVFVKHLGRGGMADVLVVRHDFLGKTFALKLLHPHIVQHPDAIHRLRREARTLGRIHSQHIVEVADFGLAANGAPFIVLELMKGKTLAQELANTGRLSVPDALLLTRQALAGLASAHDVGVVHRDLTPDNLFIEQIPGYQRTLKILDFGLAHITAHCIDDRLRGQSGMTTQAGALIGSPGYLSPEAACGKAVDARADLYALGLILYEMLTGLGPYERPEGKLLSPSEVCHDLPRALDELILRATQESPVARYQSAQDFLQAIEQLP